MFRNLRLTRAVTGCLGLLLSGFLMFGEAAKAAEPAAAELQLQPAPTEDVAPPEPSTQSVILEGGEAGSILGREVRSAADEKLGRIVDVVVDRRGATRAAVIDFGGFLGVGSRKIAVAWDILSFSAPQGGEDRIVVQTTRDRLNTAPEFKDGKPITVLGASGADGGGKVTLKAPE